MAVRYVGIAMDFSTGSKYALQWAVKNILKERDHLILVVVNKKVNDMGEMLLWEDTGSPLVPLADFALPAISSKYGIPSPDQEVIQLLEAQAQVSQLDVAFKIYWGDAREKICDAVVDLPLDCLVMGSRGLGTLKRAILGSVSNYVVNNAPCPVTVVKVPADIGP